MKKTAILYQARNLDQVLALQGRKKRWLADQVGVHESSISRIASQKQGATEEVARRIAEVLQVPLIVLFDVLERPDFGPEGIAA